jgi:hypothetical protein
MESLETVVQTGLVSGRRAGLEDNNRGRKDCLTEAGLLMGSRAASP